MKYVVGKEVLSLNACNYFSHAAPLFGVKDSRKERYRLRTEDVNIKDDASLKL